MNEPQKQVWIKFFIFMFVMGVLFRHLLPFLLIIFVLYALHKRQQKRPVIPPQYARHVPDEILNVLNKQSSTTNYSEPPEPPMETINPNKLKNIKRWLIPLILILVLLPFIGSFFVIVNAGETGVRSLFGKVNENEFSSGFHLKNPFERVTKMSIRTMEYTMSIAHNEGKVLGDDSISALTKEGLQVDLDITVLFHLLEDKAAEVYKTIGTDYEDIIIRPQIRSTIRSIIAQYEAKDIYSEKREEASRQILSGLVMALEPRGIEVEEVLLRNVNLPVNLADSIQKKLQAEQDADRYTFILEQEEKEAERKRIEAAGQRDAQVIISQSLTPRYLEYLYIQSLKDREGTIYVPTDPGNGLPLFRGI